MIIRHFLLFNVCTIRIYISLLFLIILSLSKFHIILGRYVANYLNVSLQDLINLAQEKISHQQITYKTTPRSSYGNSSLEMPAQRNSLPDIPLTPRERQILEQTSCVTPSMVRSSHSTESILRDSSPPPKPPLPENLCRSDPSSCVTPPPLPPKKKSFRAHPFMDESFNVDHSPIASSLER